MQKQVKYLIVGQGITGTWMSYHLELAGISYMLINDESMHSASSVASGVINPVTGRRIVQTWMIETLLPFAINAYTAIQEKLNINIIQSSPVILLHPSEQMKDSFNYRMAHENIYLIQQDPSKWTPYFHARHGVGGISECYWIDINKMLQTWNAYVKSKGYYLNAHFNVEDLHINENKIEWKNIIAEKIIFCDGIGSMQNPYFKSLPFAPNKGEALIIKLSELPNENIYKSNISIIPWKEDLFWVGSNYEWTYDDPLPSLAFREKMIQNLDQLLKQPYEIVDHIAGIRPTNTQRRPFIGVHPNYPQIAICNGMGTKGCSLAPYFTAQLLEHLEKGTAIEQEANLARFAKILKQNT